MMDAILEALNDALKTKEQEVKYWRERANIYELQRDELKKMVEEKTDSLAKAEERRVKYMDELEALMQDKEALKAEVADLTAIRKKLETNGDMELIERRVEELLRQYTLKKEREGKQDGGDDPYWMPGDGA